MFRVREIDDEERIDPLERHEIQPVADEPGGVDPLVRRDVFERPDDIHCGVENVDVVVLDRPLTRPALDGRRNPEVLPVLVERELVQEVSGNPAHGLILDPSVVDREPVDDRLLPAAGVVGRRSGGSHVAVADVEVLLRRKEGGVVTEEERLGVGTDPVVFDGEGACGVEDVVLQRSPGAIDVRQDGLAAVRPHLGEDDLVPYPDGGLPREDVDVVPDHPGVVVTAGEGPGPDQFGIAPIADVVDVGVRHRPLDGDGCYTPFHGGHYLFRSGGKDRQAVACKEERRRESFDPGFGDDSGILCRERFEDRDGLARYDVDVSSVVLQEVGLIDTLYLHVRGRVVACGRRGGRRTRRCRRVHGGLLSAGPRHPGVAVTAPHSLRVFLQERFDLFFRRKLQQISLGLLPAALRREGGPDDRGDHETPEDGHQHRVSVPHIRSPSDRGRCTSLCFRFA
ncbi:hypothetical protein DSECCO2_410160 [anaerobic digester metagenome]